MKRTKGVYRLRANENRMCWPSNEGGAPTVYLRERRLEEIETLIIYLDQVPIGQHEMVLAIGVDPKGRQWVLGFRVVEGHATQTTATMFDDLFARGLVLRGTPLFIIGDSRPLRTAVNLINEEAHEVQRCRKDREARVLNILPTATKRRTRSLMRMAWEANYREGLSRLQILAREIGQEYPLAAERVLENLDECFTVDRLGIRPPLSRALVQTTGLKNLVDSVVPRDRQVQEDANEMTRSIAVALTEKEPKLRRLTGYRALPHLQSVLKTRKSSRRWGTPPAVDQQEPKVSESPLASSSAAGFSLAPAQNATAKGEQRLPEDPPSRCSAPLQKLARLIEKSWSPAGSRCEFNLLMDPRPVGQDAHPPPEQARSCFSREARIARQEEFKLVQALFLSTRHDRPKIVVFSGVEPNNGCSRVSARVGVTLAKYVSASVCVVDANLLAPSLHQYFGVGNQIGLLGALINSNPVRQCAHNLSLGNLWVMPTGTMPPNLSLGSVTYTQITEFVNNLRHAFDYVLIDVPPLVSQPFGNLLSRHTDGVVLILEAGVTNRQSALQLKRDLENTGTCFLGAVLNKRTFPIPDWIYKTVFGASYP